MGVCTFAGSWIATAAVRYTAAESYWTLLIEALGDALWFGSLFLFRDWDDYRRLAPTIVGASLAGTAIGLRVP